jgi:predicted dehydrogenase
MTRIGIIGTGAIARVHLDGWRNLPVELVGYYDIDRAAAERAQAVYGGRVYDTLAALLADVDMVDICTPGTAHKEPLLAAAAANKAIICEKPLARRLADCQEMVAACERAGVPLYPAHVVRFFPEFAQAKQVIESGAIGNPAVMRTVRAGSFPRPGGAFSADYYGDFSRSGRVVLDVGIHDIDYQRWCCGEVERVFARGTTFTEAPRNDHALITLRFASGALGHVQCSWAHPAGLFRTRLEIAGDGGIVEWDSLDTPSLLAHMRSADDRQHERRGGNPIAPDEEPYRAELAHFLHCFETGATPRVTAHDGLMAVKIALAAIESMRTGAPIDIANFQEAPL